MQVEESQAHLETAQQQEDDGYDEQTMFTRARQNVATLHRARKMERSLK
jgi:hypothetical protein